MYCRSSFTVNCIHNSRHNKTSGIPWVFSNSRVGGVNMVLVGEFVAAQRRLAFLSVGPLQRSLSLHVIFAAGALSA